MCIPRAHSRPVGVHERSSCRSLVFVEETAEKVAPRDLRRAEGGCRRKIGSAVAIRWSQVERSVWTLLVKKRGDNPAGSPLDGHALLRVLAVAAVVADEVGVLAGRVVA